MNDPLTYFQIKSNPSRLADFGREELIHLECTHCKKEFVRRKRNLIDTLSKPDTIGITCSTTCRSKLYGHLVETSCAFCSEPIEVKSGEISASGRNYCSRSCAAKENNKSKQRNPPKNRTCKQCNATFTLSSKHKSPNHCRYCIKNNPSSADFYKQKTKGDYSSLLSVKGRCRSWASSHIRLFCKSWNSDLVGIPCQKCGYHIHTELCHIKPVSKFDDGATLGEINHPDNIVVLCSNHHWELDNGHLALKDIPFREGQTSRVIYPDTTPTSSSTST